MDTNKEKTALTNIIDMQKLQGFLDVLKIYGNKIYTFFKDNKNNSTIMLVLAMGTFGLAIYFGVQLYIDIQYLNAKTPELININTYDNQLLQNATSMQDTAKNVDTLYDLLQENKNQDGDISKYTQYLQSLQVPYNYLLQYVYLPSLNIWKEKYTDTIHTDMIGLKFLQDNPFDDIKLLQQWSDFFRNLWDNNESNDVTDIKIGDIAEDGKWFFSMPITVSFVANSKRSFLLLVDKLSMTSNKTNIALINEFFYYLRQEIKSSKTKEITGLWTTYASIFGTGDTTGNVDKIIWYHLYNRIFNNQNNILLDDDIVNKTIKSVASCAGVSDEVCYYKFREKYRDLPSFGYLFGTDFATSPTSNVKKFILQLPPIFSLEDFTFDKVKSPTVTDMTNVKYQGKITIQVYGRWVSDAEVQEIMDSLWEKCLGYGKALTVDDGVRLVQEAIAKLSDASKVDSQTSDLWELKNTIDQLNTDYPSFNNYKKIIKLFELSRMLNDAGLCE